MLKPSSTTKTLATGLGAVALSFGGLALSADNAQAASLVTKTYTVSFGRESVPISLTPSDFSPFLPKFSGGNLKKIDISLSSISYGSAKISNNTPNPPAYISLSTGTNGQILSGGTTGFYAIAPLYNANGLVSNQVRARRANFNNNVFTGYADETTLSLRTNVSASSLLTNSAKYNSFAAANTFTYQIAVDSISVAQFQTLYDTITPLLAPSSLDGVFGNRPSNLSFSSFNPAVLTYKNFDEIAKPGSTQKTLNPGELGFDNFIGTGPLNLEFTVSAGFDLSKPNINAVSTSEASGEATIAYTYAVPEPLTMLGAATAVSFGAAFKRRALKNSKKD